MGYVHSVKLNKDKCRGCTNCIKYCPTEAIRVRDGKAVIIDERCIDCGECIRRCPHQAKEAVTDSLEMINNFEVKIAIPAPAFYGQFKKDISINQILCTLTKIGFDFVYEVAESAELVTRIIKEKMDKGELEKPAISSACPVIIRLIQVRFPELIKYVIRIESPMELGARIIKEKIAQQKGIDLKKIGVFFISPCPAKMTSVKSHLSSDSSWVDGVLSISEVFTKVISNLVEADEAEDLQRSTNIGIRWATSGGEANSLNLDLEQYLAVDGSENVIKVLEKLEMGKLPDVKFFEGQACLGGCVGGSLTIENSFIAQKRIQYFAEKSSDNEPQFVKLSDEEWENIKLKGQWVKELYPREIMKLDSDRGKALEKLNRIEEIYETLPGLDCGSCGAPTCRAFAEDIVKGLSNEVDCIFILREKLRDLAENMVELSNKLPPVIGSNKENKDDLKK